jgi:hypothetical protein
MERLSIGFLCKDGIVSQPAGGTFSDSRALCRTLNRSYGNLS